MNIRTNGIRLTLRPKYYVKLNVNAIVYNNRSITMSISFYKLTFSMDSNNKYYTSPIVIINFNILILIVLVFVTL